MVFCIYFTFTCVLLLLLYANNTLVFKQAAFLFLIVCLIHTHTFILIPENFKGFYVSDTVQHYISYLLVRTLVVPASFVFCFVLGHKRVMSIRTMIFVGLLFSLAMALVDGVGESLKLYHYLWWNFNWSILYFFLLFIISYFLYILFLRVEEAV